MRIVGNTRWKLMSLSPMWSVVPLSHFNGQQLEALIGGGLVYVRRYGDAKFISVRLTAAGNDIRNAAYERWANTLEWGRR